MNEIIVAFPKKEIAINIRNILVRGGIDVPTAELLLK